jgi:hypothetical protein
MSVQTELDRIIGLVHESHEKAQAKGGTTTTPLLANLPGVIESIPQGVELPELGDKAAQPTDIVSGKELYDDQGNPITGTMNALGLGGLCNIENATINTTGDGVKNLLITGKTSNNKRAYADPGTTVVVNAEETSPAISCFGNATAADVAAGKTFTSAAGLLVTGTASGGGSGGGGFPNGTEWTQSNITSGYISSIHNVDGLWVAVVQGNGIYYSRNGKTWVQSNITNQIYSPHINYVNGIWFAFYYDKPLYYSTDGMTWTQSNLVWKDNSDYTVCYAKGVWVINNGSTGIYYSTDGMTWTQSNVATNTYSIHYANGIWVASNTDGYIRHSTDGMTWETGSVWEGALYSIHYADGIWAAYYSSSYNSTKKVRYSTDGITWTNSKLGLPAKKTYVITYLNGIWLIIPSDGNFYYSTDGITWTDGGSIIASSTNGEIYDIHYANGIWVAGHSTSGLKYSTDGITWTQSNVTTLGGNIPSVHYANGIWVASGNKGYYSVDGKTWTQSNTTCDDAYNANGIWVAGGNSTGLWYSVTWEPTT